jgi:hypothetical protein
MIMVMMHLTALRTRSRRDLTRMTRIRVSSRRCSPILSVSGACTAVIDIDLDMLRIGMSRVICAGPILRGMESGD